MEERGKDNDITRIHLTYSGPALSFPLFVCWCVMTAVNHQMFLRVASGPSCSSPSPATCFLSICLFSQASKQLRQVATTATIMHMPADIHIPFRYKGASLEGKTFVPRTGPHWPMVYITTYAPPLLLSLALMLAVQASKSATDAKMMTDKNVDAYLGADVSVVALMMNPTAAIIDVSTRKGPRILRRSDSQEQRRMTRKQSAYGGAERPSDVTVLNEPVQTLALYDLSSQPSSPTHLTDDRWQEERQRSETDVASEVTQGQGPALDIEEGR